MSERIVARYWLETGSDPLRAALAPNAVWLALFALLMGGWSASTADAGRIAGWCSSAIRCSRI
jgi:hypothetical protein